MDLEIEPQPSPEEREAIELALRRLIEGPSIPAAYRSAWRAEGIREAVAGDRGGPYMPGRRFIEGGNAVSPSSSPFQSLMFERMKPHREALLVSWDQATDAGPRSSFGATRA